jgi:hypothetical protein
MRTGHFGLAAGYGSSDGGDEKLVGLSTKGDNFYNSSGNFGSIIGKSPD